MEKNIRSHKELRKLGVPIGCALSILLIIVVTCAEVVQASGNGWPYRMATSHGEPKNTISEWQMAEMVCCHCYSTKSDGTRFYHGVLEAGFCRSHRGYCEGFAKCFP